MCMVALSTPRWRKGRRVKVGSDSLFDSLLEGGVGGSSRNVVMGVRSM